MVVWQGKSKRKPSGGLFHSWRKKRKFEMGRNAALTKIGSVKRKKIRTMGGNEKLRAISLTEVNYYDSKKKKADKAKMISVEENTANRHYKRANIITKGTLVKTDKGFIKVTNRPGQDGLVQGILLPDYVPVKSEKKTEK